MCCRLLPFAVYVAFPRADYYGSSVAISVTALRRSRVPRVMNVPDDPRRSTHVLAPAYCRRSMITAVQDDLTLHHPYYQTTGHWNSSNPAFAIAISPCRIFHPLFPPAVCPFPVSLSGKWDGLRGILAISPCSLREQFIDAVTRRSVRCSTS